MDKTVTVRMEAEGFDEATAKIENFADAMREIPATVNIKARDCNIEVHTSNYVADEDTKVTTRASGQLDILDQRHDIKQALVAVKEMCEDRTNCKGCFMSIERSNGTIGCRTAAATPDDWEL